MLTTTHAQCVQVGKVLTTTHAHGAQEGSVQMRARVTSKGEGKKGTHSRRCRVEEGEGGHVLEQRFNTVGLIPRNSIRQGREASHAARVHKPGNAHRGDCLALRTKIRMP